jgi:hypothetical protein
MTAENGRARAAAILIDFDNVCLGLANAFGAHAARSFALSPQAWLSWFSAGGHAGANDGGERRFIVRRAYMSADSFRRSRQLQNLFASSETRNWSSSDENDPFAIYQRVQRAFTTAGVEIIDLPPVSGLRPSATVRIAIDALELLEHATRVDEFVFLTGDADLTVVLSRLRAQGRSTALLCETGAAEAVEGLVDAVVRPEDFVRRAFDGKPAVRTLIETVQRAMNAESEYEPEFELEDDSTDPELGDEEIESISERLALAESPGYELLPRVAKRVAQAIEQSGRAIESVDLLPVFKEFPEFSQVRSDQRGAWFGAGGLSNLIRRLAALEPRLKLDIRGARATRAGRLVDRIFVDAAPPPAAKTTGRRRSAAQETPPPERSVVDRALDVIKDEVARSQTPLHMAYLRLQVMEELGSAAAAAGLADVGGKALKDAALRYGVEPYALVEPRAGYVLVMDPARHEMPE